MKPVKYFLLARFIRLFLQFGFLFAVLAIIFNILINAFGLKPYIKGDDWVFGNTIEGHTVVAGLSINIPDTIVYYGNGRYNGYKSDVIKYPYKFQSKDTIEQKILNRFEVYEKEGIEISNKFYVPDGVNVFVKSTNWRHNLFWILSSQLGYIYSALFFLVLIKLTNRYMDEEIFEERSFKLVASLGWLFIGNEVLRIIISFINGFILQHPGLQSTSLIDKRHYRYIDISFDFFNGFSFSNIGIGILIVLLAEVLRAAVFTKKEQELTI